MELEPQEWFHGTNDDRFSRWIFPPPSSLTKPELYIHSMSFLTTDRILALRAGKNICRSRISSGAKVLEITRDLHASEMLRNQVLMTELGKYHDYVQNFEYWIESWTQGRLLRYGSNHPDLKYKLETTQRLAEKYIAGSRETKHRDAWLKAQNLTREWIELIGKSARNMGFDALIGNEIDSRRLTGPVACPVLFVLTEHTISSPIWE